MHSKVKNINRLTNAGQADEKADGFRLSPEEKRRLVRLAKMRAMIGRKVEKPMKPLKTGPTNPGWFAPTTGPAWLESKEHRSAFFIDRMLREPPPKKVAKDPEAFAEWMARRQAALDWLAEQKRKREQK